MGAGLDINGRYAQSWKVADVSKIAVPKATRNKKELLESIKKVIFAQVKALCGNKEDTKYRNIVDLVMLRVNSELDAVQIDVDIDLDFNDVIQSTKKSIGTIVDGIYGNTKQMSLAEFVDQVTAKVKSFAAKYTFKGKKITQNEKAEIVVEHKEQYNETQVKPSTQKDQAKRTSAEAKDIKKKALQSIQLNVNAQSDKIFALCSVSSMAKIHQTKLKQKVIKKKKKKSPIKKQFKAIKLLEKRQTNTIFVDQSKKQQEKTMQTVEKMPSDIAQNNIYRYNKDVFKGLSVASVMLTLGIIGTVQNHASAVRKAFGVVPFVLSKWFENTIKLIKKIYNALHKNVLQQIFEFVKKRIFKQLLKPLKDKLVGLIKGMMPSWIKKFINTVNSFFKAVKSLAKMIIKGLGKLFKWIIRKVRTILGVFKKMFGKPIDLIKTAIRTIFKRLTDILKWAAKALRTIFKFLKNGVKFIGKLFKNSKIGKLFSKVGSKIKGVFNRVKGGIKKMASKVKNLFSKSKNFFKNMFSNAKNAIKNAIQNALKTVKNFMKKILTRIFNVVKNTIKKVIQTIMKKLGITMAKKIAKKKAKSLLMMGAKKILSFFKKWVVKLIAKLATKILSAAAVNAIPILGQIVSACMMIYTIVDTIVMFWDVYQFLKENPAAWDYIKEKVAEWASKAFDIGKKLTELGKKLFQAVFIDGPKALAKGAALLLIFIVNPFAVAKCKAKEAIYIKALDKIKTTNLAKLNTMSLNDRSKFIKDNYKRNMKEIDKLRPKANMFSVKIKDEQESWWPNNKKIMQWLDQRQGFFESMMAYASELGLSDFSERTCSKAKAIVEDQEKKEAQMKNLAEELAKRRKEMAIRYENKRIDINALQKICKEQQEKQSALSDEIKMLTKEISTKSNNLIDFFQNQIDDNNGKNKNTTKNNNIVIYAA